MGYNTIEELKSVFSKALELISDRDTRYGDRWKDQPVEEILIKAGMKVDGIRYQFRNHLLGNKERLLEDIRDGINYLAFLHRRIENEED